MGDSEACRKAKGSMAQGDVVALTATVQQLHAMLQSADLHGKHAAAAGIVSCVVWLTAAKHGSIVRREYLSMYPAALSLLHAGNKHTVNA